MDSSLIMYLLIFAAIYILSFVLEKNKYKENGVIVRPFNDNAKVYPARTLLILLIALIPAIVAGIRYFVGQDYYNYMITYTQYANGATFNRERFGGINIEIGFYLVNFISIKLFNDFHGFLFLIALITYGVATVSLVKYHRESYAPIMMLGYFATLLGPSFNIIRQIAAVSIIAYSYRFIEEKKIVKYVIGVLIAATFHVSALFFLPVYFFYSDNTKKNRTRQYIIIAIAMIFPLLFSRAFELIGNYSIFSKYYRLYATDFSAEININRLLIHVPAALMIIISYKDIISEEKNKLYLLIYIFKYVVIISSFFTNYAFRLMYYCIPAELILIGYAINNTGGRKRTILKWMSFAYYLAYFIYSFYIRNLDGIFPYISILQQQ